MTKFPVKIFIFTILSMIFLFKSSAYAETVKIIAEDDWYPYSAKFPDGPKGIAVDISRAAFEAEGYTVDFESMNYDRCMELVKDGEAIGCFDAPRSDEIENIYLWHDEKLYAAEGHFYVRPDFQEKIKTLKDLAGKKVGLTQGYGYGSEIDLNTEMLKEYSKTDTILIQKLVGKRLDIILLWDKCADYLIPKLDVPGQIKAEGPTQSIDLYIAFSKKNPEGQKYRDIFSKGFKKIKENGTYQKIWEDWDAKLKATPADKSH